MPTDETAQGDDTVSVSRDEAPATATPTKAPKAATPVAPAEAAAPTAAPVADSVDHPLLAVLADELATERAAVWAASVASVPPRVGVAEQRFAVTADIMALAHSAAAHLCQQYEHLSFAATAQDQEANTYSVILSAPDA